MLFQIVKHQTYPLIPNWKYRKYYFELPHCSQNKFFKCTQNGFILRGFRLFLLWSHFSQIVENWINVFFKHNLKSFFFTQWFGIFCNFSHNRQIWIFKVEPVWSIPIWNPQLRPVMDFCKIVTATACDSKRGAINERVLLTPETPSMCFSWTSLIMFKCFTKLLLISDTFWTANETCFISLINLITFFT